MKIAESWLREWVNPDFDTEALGHQLTMLGHEVDGIDSQGEGLEDVVVACVVETEKHPNADKLTLCKVDDGSGELFDVVCGAPNVVKGMKTPLARPGVRLPNGMKLRKAKIRGVVSNGMLCSAVELGLGEESDGILHLPDSARAGDALVSFLDLPDASIDLDLTPNRGDCFSVLGIARDISALTGAALKAADVDVVAADSDAVQAVELPEPSGCPRFAGRLVTGIDTNAGSPVWMTERLRRSGLRPISPVVDITNYVMLELGQPLHAYDAEKVQGTIRPVFASGGESLTLLDEKTIELQAGTMVITDDSGAIGLAGIMGGLSTAVSDTTTDVFFEAAFWPQDVMAGKARSYGMHTDASLRFERGVDPEGQARAVERATELLVAIAGGVAGPLNDIRVSEHLPECRPIKLRRAQVARLLGTTVADEQIEQILQRLQMRVEATADGWSVVAPSHRFDIAIEADLIEEIARIFGYDSIPVATEIAASPLRPVTESTVDLDHVSSVLIGRDYQEVVNYSFVDAETDQLLTGQESELVLSNPISAEMSVMRGSLLSGLVQTASTNVARQQERVRVFEISRTFHGGLQNHIEEQRIGGLILGPRAPEQWGEKGAGVDFFDIKSDVEAILELSASLDDVRFKAADHPALQPGQSAEILRDGKTIGVVGKLHPGVAKAFDLKPAVFVFELHADAALQSQVAAASAISRFPAIRRDIAVVVSEDVSAAELKDAVMQSAGSLIKAVKIFDVYTGPGIEAGLKSVAIGLILQETSRTLTDEDADGAMAAAIKNLEDKFAAVLRD